MLALLYSTSKMLVILYSTSKDARGTMKNVREQGCSRYYYFVLKLILVNFPYRIEVIA